MSELDELYNTFIEEAREQTAEVEACLMRLERSPEDMDSINAVFRAMHTIKGTSNSLGQVQIAEFAHAVEDLLEVFRQKKMLPGRESISLLLSANDLIREMTASVKSEHAFDTSRCESLKKALKDVRNKGTLRQLRIIFVPDRRLLQWADPADFINALSAICEITRIEAYTDAVPPLSELKLGELYLRWDIWLKTDREEDEVRRIFAASGEKSELKVIPVAPSRKELPFLGQMLVDKGSVNEEDVDNALRDQKKLGEILVEREKADIAEIENMVAKQRIEKIESLTRSVASTIRVDLGKLDQLVNAVGEMVIVHSMMEQLIEDMETNSMSERFTGLFSQLKNIGEDIRENTLSLRMLPVRDVFQRFVRLVREISGSMNKKIDIVIAGEETELDKGVLEKVTDPLVHLVRNAIDHGIETPEERTSKGKPAHGTIHLIAYQMGGAVYIEVEDDGRGLDKNKIIEKAIHKGTIAHAAGLSDEQIYDLIFLPGFSTAAEVTGMSGRGVGMDVVKKSIEDLRGRIIINTRQEMGTTFTIKLPLTLAIIDGLIVRIGDQVFVIPLASVVESFRPRRHDVKTLHGRGEVIDIMGEYVPLVRLHEELVVAPSVRDPHAAIVILVSHEDRMRCLLVDEILGHQQVAIKNLGKALPKVRDISGGTILGDGKVALVLDVRGIIEHSAIGHPN